MKQKVYSRWPKYQKVSPLADCIDKHRTTIWDVFILSWRLLEGPLCTVLSRKPSWPTSAQHPRHRTVCGVSVARAARRRDLQGAVQPWQRKRDLCLPAAGDAGTREKGVPTVRAETPCVVEEMGRQGTLSPAVKRNGLYSTAHRRLPRLTQKKEHTHFQIKKKKKNPRHWVRFWVVEREHMKCCPQSGFWLVPQAFFQFPASPDPARSNPARVQRPRHTVYSLPSKRQDADNHTHEGCQAIKQRLISILVLLQFLTATLRA